MEQPAALMQQKLLVSKAGAFISAAIDTLKPEHIGLGGRRKSSCWAVSSRAVCKHQSPDGSIGKFCLWITASTLNNEVDIPDSELAVESEMLVLQTGGLAAKIRAQWLRWRAAADLDYTPRAGFISDLQKIGDGTYINIALNVTALRQLSRRRSYMHLDSQRQNKSKGLEGRVAVSAPRV